MVNDRSQRVQHSKHSISSGGQIICIDVFHLSLFAAQMTKWWSIELILLLNIHYHEL